MKFDEFLKNNILVLDGGMGTMVQALGLSDKDYGGAEFSMLTDLIAFSKPDQLQSIHYQYFQAGAHAVETNTFGASALRLAEYDFSKIDVSHFQGLPEGLDIRTLSYDELAYHINVAAARVARQALAAYKKTRDYDKRDLFVLGCVGPSNWVLSPTQADLKQGTYEQIVQNFYRQVLGLIDGGVDGLSFDTAQDQLELKAAIHGGQKAMQERDKKLPVIAHVTVDAFSRMQLFHTDILAALTTVSDIGIDAFGINCSIGPDLMEPTLKLLSEFSSLPISVLPNAGLPQCEGGCTVFKLKPAELAAHIKKFVRDYGVTIVGGCCGTGPEHIRAVADVVRGIKPKKRNVKKQVFVSGPQKAVCLDSRDELIRIGERLNVRGSKKVRDAVEREAGIDFPVLEDVVNEQLKDLGLSLIDVCMDSNVVNTDETLCAVIQELAKDFSGAMCLDSFSAETLAKAVAVYPGKPLINSISLEEVAEGLDKIDALVAPTAKHGPVYIALCAGPEGPAKTAADKYALAKKIMEKCDSVYGVKPHQLIIDVNAFPIGSESQAQENFALESLQAIAKIKSLHPDLKVSIGVGNLTNGLAKKPYMRLVLTSYFLSEGRQQGLDAAIINPQHYVPVESLEKEHVRLAQKIIYEHDMEAFAALEKIAMERKGKSVAKVISYDELPVEQAVCARIRDGFKQRDKGQIVAGNFSFAYDDAIVPQVAVCLNTIEPLVFINQYLMKAMQELGDGFSRGEVSLPHLLKAADVMKHAMRFIEAKIKFQNSGETAVESHKGTVILGTVYQDVHSIGKDLVKTLFENYGYQVRDLGVQVSLEKFVEEARKHKAVAIGLSALLVQTSHHMVQVAKMALAAGLQDAALLIGGAPVNQRHAAAVAMHEQHEVSKLWPHVFYCSSAMDGVNVLNQFTTKGNTRQELIQKNKVMLEEQLHSATQQSQQQQKKLNALPRRVVSDFTRTEKFDSRVMLLQLSLKELAPHLDKKALFSLNWKFGGKASWEKKGLDEAALEQLLEEWLTSCEKHQWIVPQAVCQLLPCQAQGDVLYLYEAGTEKKIIGQVAFPVVVAPDQKTVFSVAQYFCSRDSASVDVAGLQVVTAGKQVEEQVARFQEASDVESAWLLQGLANRVAEDMAELAQQHLRKVLGVGLQTGRRYSPGYPALPDLLVNQLIVDLLQAKNNLALDVTSVGALIPACSTAALVCFHPDAC